MSQRMTSEVNRVDVLRAEFDSVFTRAPAGTERRLETLLAIRVGEAPYAIRLSQAVGLHVDKPITSLPGTPPEVLGIAGFRGTIATVFDLGVLLGSGATKATRWLVLASTSPALGFAFDDFEGHLQFSPKAISTAAYSERREFSSIEEAVPDAGGRVRPIVNLSALIEVISKPERNGR
jgi:chemotaxis signal transduction protein